MQGRWGPLLRTFAPSYCRMLSSSSGAPDKIHIAGMQFYGRHGVLPEVYFLLTSDIMRQPHARQPCICLVPEDPQLLPHKYLQSTTMSRRPNALCCCTLYTAQLLRNFIKFHFNERSDADYRKRGWASPSTWTWCFTVTCARRVLVTSWSTPSTMQKHTGTWQEVRPAPTTHHTCTQPRMVLWG